jgi:hypothetical protein
VELMLYPSLHGPPLYSGEGVHLAPPPRHLGQWPRERRPRAVVARVGPAPPPPKP